jgi:hypothetical protein
LTIDALNGYPLFALKRRSERMKKTPSRSERPESCVPIPLTVAVNNVVAPGDAPRGRTSERLLSALIERVRALFPNAKGWNPYSDEDSNIEIGIHGSERIKLDDLMTTTLAPLGYRRVDKLTYRADWSTAEVEHVLSIDTCGNPKAFLHGSAGLRNTEADAFARQCQQRYADNGILRAMREGAYVEPPWYCLMSFSIGAFFGWPGWSLNTREFSPNALARAVADPIRAKLIPYVGGVTTLQSLPSFLECDEEPMQWIMHRADLALPSLPGSPPNSVSTDGRRRRVCSLMLDSTPMSSTRRD